MSNSEWGAIPRSLANDVSNMIEKKMGTSSGYKPVEWVSQINLMGKLPIKSASGAIASFSDGADGVPVKSCVVSFTPSGGGGTPSAPVAIQGVSGVSVTRTGKNLLENTASSTTESNVTFTVNSDGSVSLSGISSAEINFNIYSNLSFPKTGNYFISGCPVGGSTSTYRIFATNYGSDTGNGLSANVTDLATKTTIRINIKSGTNTDGLVFKPMISVGSTATTYEAYKTPSVVTDTFGQTIYGGTRDMTTDKASVTYSEPVVLTESMIDSATAYSYQSKNGVQIASVFTKNVYRLNNHRCSHDVVKQGADSASHYLWFGSSTGNKSLYWIGILDDLNMTLAEWKAWAKTQTIQCSYVLPTPTEITGLTPHAIDTLYGDNNIYADTGTTTVEYRADIDLALNA